MSIHVALRHVTRYRYDRPVSVMPQVVRLRPAPHCRTPILSYSLKIEPARHFINWQQDPQSNFLARLVFEEKTREFAVEVELVAEMSVYNPFDFFLEPQAEHYPFRYDPALIHELEPFQRKLPVTPHFGEYLRGLRAQILSGRAGLMPVSVPHSEIAADPHAGGHFPEAGLLHHEVDHDRRVRTIDFLVALNQAIWRDIRYLVRLEPGVQTPEETLELGSGSCRDSAWLLCQILRHLGLAARFVSGYLIQLKPDVASLDGPSGAERDFTDLHAWCEVYLPGAGWIGLDPTSGLLAGEGHLPLAATPDPQSAAPITGMVEKCGCEFSYEMGITRILESPRVTKPYSDAQWAAMDALGAAVDDKLKAGDVRLTMGGEPTFVSIDDMDGAEWNTAAVGPTKRLLSGDLLRRLKDHFAPGGLLFHAQGKWYPGESLPRWALACYWRKDGVPMWKDESLFANERQDYGQTEDDAMRFGQALAERLGVSAEAVAPAFEDVFYYLWKERRLPVNVDPHDSKLDDPQERARLARLFSKGLDKVTGYLLPLRRRENGSSAWMTGKWHVRDERIYLTPGDSAMGLRLPLDSLPWVVETDYPWLHQQDPFSSWPPLPGAPDHRAFAASGFPPAWPGAAVITQQPWGIASGVPGAPPPGGNGPGTGETPALFPTAPENRLPTQGESAPWVVRTAICFEPREGRLHVFLPPVATTLDFLDLIAAVEDTAAALRMPIVIEGAPPPYDPRIDVFKITPDPGVIEVNLQPASSWQEMVRNTTVLYDEARLSRLGTEKFMLDGRHTGTGGGNHIVFGGETPADSPILRRPHLLRSLLTYWNNHPSLSYLFSGLFIGPTSQHPRIDEARHDAVRELELAFSQIPDSGNVPSWLVDRVFRNLLVDATGNTHRTEFCIDKLFDPSSATGRLGLVELRSFEMPPHARMSLAQQLLLRSMIARFWDAPRTTPLVRWGTELTDRFMLPHWVWEDFSDVIDDMTAAGYAFEKEWFAPHHEFRFPMIGRIEPRGIALELRTALEPWHVLGEEGAGGGTVRYVDSSLERLQVKVRGFNPSRFVIACNGRRVPLHPTGTVGEYVAGVRYRAWQPPNCLHPTIGVHSPLVFDVVDTWNGRSVAGCTYHVTHPGGRSYDTFPVNAYEAESRRLARFFTGGHTPGPLPLAPVEDRGEFPMTLDLRGR